MGKGFPLGCLVPRHHWLQRLCPGSLPLCREDKRVFVQCCPPVLHLSFLEGLL